MEKTFGSRRAGRFHRAYTSTCWNVADAKWHKSLKTECIRPGTPLSLDDARRLVQGYVEHYNNIRLNSAVATSRQRTCSPGASRRFTANGPEIGSGQAAAADPAA